ncbi:hypothetical protein WR25_08442 [Diploscapter pachys]|uniref:Uncharacterized protein n=1 Tax=Diploscapter pachys TaxID=2018661 RepID=A0A2A2K759_9BILA|nr:hypothetical protein WR25_08442 [Diploscapter pachys]
MVRHVEEVGVAAGVQLIGAVQLHAALGEQVGQHAVDDRRAQLRLDVVADDRDAGILELLRPFGVRRDEDRDVVDEGDSGFQRAFGVEFGRFLAADGQVVHQHVGAARLQVGDDLLLSRLRVVGDHEGAIVLVVAHMVGDAIEHGAHLHDRAGRGDVGGEDRGAIGLGEDRLGDVLAHLARIDIPGGDDLDVRRLIAADFPVHQADRVVRAFAIIFESLDQ